MKLIVLAAALSALFPRVAATGVNCQTLLVPVNASAQNTIITAPLPNTTTDVIETVSTLISLNGATNYSNAYFAGTQEISGTYMINARLCTPSTNQAHASTVLLLIHGINGDITYWDTSYENYKYSFVNAAGQAGYSTLAIDRLGIGGSDKPDGTSVVQTQLETDIARQLAAGLRQGSLGFNQGGFSKVVAVGHSYGSLQSNLLINETPDAVDAVVLTGFSHNATGMAAFNAATQVAIANQVNQTFADLPNSYLLGTSTYGAQLAFFYSQGADPNLISLILQNPQTVTTGETATMSAGAVPAYSFTGPVLIATGSNDVPFCAGSCFGANYESIVSLEAQYYTGSSQFTAYSPAGTGHFINYHYSAPQTYSFITNWLAQNGL